MGGAVAEIVRFINNDEVIHTPIEMSQVYCAAAAILPVEVCMVQNRVVQPVLDEHIAFITQFCKYAPVVSQAFWAENQNIGSS